MNEPLPNSNNPEDEKIAQRLNQVAEQTQANAQFAAELEERLRATRLEKKSQFTALFGQVSPSLRLAFLMILLAVALSWSIKTLIPTPQISGATTPNGFVCPVTQPNGSLPPGTQTSETAGVSDPNLFGNDELWTVLWPDGKVYMLSSNQRSDGSFETNWPWFRGVEGQLTIEGHRLDSQADPLQFELPEGFNNFQGSTLIFPTIGCWEITGRVGNATLTFVTEILFDATIPTPTAITTPNIVAQGTITPVVKSEGYDWRGTKLYLATSLPESPAEANVFVAKTEKPATIESVRALASQFGMQGEISETELEPNAPSAFSVVDGNQRLNVRSDRYFEYIPDDRLTIESRFSLSNPNAEAIIDEFMKSHHFDFPYTIEPSELYQAFYVQALTPDGFPIHHEYLGQNGLLLRLNENQIVSVSASLLEYDQVGTYGIKSAEDAFQQVAASTDYNGMIEGVHSSGTPPQIWKRDYPLRETMTLYGWLSAAPSPDGQGLLVSIDGFQAKGNLSGVETLGKITLVKATGQFTLENEIKVFDVDSWEIFKRDDKDFSGKDAFFGTLQKQGEDVVVVSEKGTFIMPDVPADVPLPLENAYVYGVTVGDVFEWEGIEYAEPGQGGGGGGSNGMGFYKLNLSGPPMLFPTSTPQPEANQGTTEYVVQENDTLSSIALNLGITVDELRQMNGLEVDTVTTGQILIVPNAQSNQSLQSLIGQRLEGARGSFVVTIYQQADGNQRAQYGLTIPPGKGPFEFAVLEGDTLKDLHTHNNLPLDVWGTVERIDPDGTPVIHVERYEIPFPDLEIQLLRGTQRMTELEGQQAVLFTTEDGTVYAQMMAFNVPDTTILGVEGDDVILEALAIPQETFGGYPTLRWFSGAMAVNPKNSQITEMTVTANQPNIVDETENGPATDPLNLLTASIETVELVYYVPDTRYATFDETSDAQYIQPAWRFYGHYSNGDEFEILIQALKQEYLSPELVPFTRPG